MPKKTTTKSTKGANGDAKKAQQKPINESQPKTDTGWFMRGQDGYKVRHQIDAAAKLKRERFAPRFRLRAGESAEVIFVDDNPFFIWEHNLQVNGNWGNYVTCLKDAKTCPICDSGKKSVFTAYFTVIDRREWTNDDTGKVTKDRKILYPAKGSTIDRIQDLSKKHGSLKGMGFVVKRYDANDPNCGTNFDETKRYTLRGENGVPFDYSKILRPLEDVEIQSLGFSSTTVGGASLEDTVKQETTESQQLGKLEEII